MEVNVGKHAIALASISLLSSLQARWPATTQGPGTPPRDEQIAAAVLALPNELREGATVLGYGANGKLTTLRDGSGTMTCLANDSRGKDFHVACYHKSLEPFMARGRELRGQGVKDPEVDSVRFREAKSGRLKLPTSPASLYQIFGGSFDPKAGTVVGGRFLYVVYIPYATAATTGLSERPARGTPWIMFPGTPKAHIMFTPSM
jgi:hypothetical protein